MKRYVMIVTDHRGSARYAQVAEPRVPDDFRLAPGETVFVVEAFDVRSRHNHEMPS